MRKNRRTIALLLACLLLTACGKNDPIPTETSTPIETTAPAETVSQSPEAMGLDGLTVQTAEGLADVTCEETEDGMRFTSANPAGQMQDILLRKEMETVYGHYYEMVYRFTSNTAGTVRFSGEGAAYYESNEFEEKKAKTRSSSVLQPERQKAARASSAWSWAVWSSSASPLPPSPVRS